MSDAGVHIAAWEAAGLIDRATADRLRAAEVGAGTPTEPIAGEAATATATVPRSAASAMFGPGVAISEVFAYLGGAFLLAAWTSLIFRTSSSAANSEVAVGIMSLIAAAVLAGLGLRLRRGGERASRAAGVAFILVTSYVAGAVVWFAEAVGLGWPANGVLASAAALAVAVALRAVHPSVLTQAGVLGWLTSLAASILTWVQDSFFPVDYSYTTGLPTTSGPDPILLVIGSGAWWLATALIIGFIGLREARAGERHADAATTRRAAVSRFWAGITAVVGLSSAVSRSATLEDGVYGRVLEPWIGVLALLILAAVLVERAFRRDATSFIYAAALALIVALTDLNVSYLSNSVEAALLIEGLILIGVGIAADRLRRRIGEPGGAPPLGEARVAPPLVEASASEGSSQGAGVPSVR